MASGPPKVALALGRLLPSRRRLANERVNKLLVVGLLVAFGTAKGQTSKEFAEAVRREYKIPEIAYAVVSADRVFELQTLGFQRINTSFGAKPNDRFHLGSNTKAIITN